MPYQLIEEPESQESTLQSGLRNVGRNVSNLLTRGAGIVGDIASIPHEYLANPIVEALGGKSIPYEESHIGKILPTTETHRKNVEPYLGEYAKPKDETEKFVDDIVEDTALLLSPAGKSKFLTKIFPSSLLKSLGANFAGKAAEDISGDKPTGDYTKMGSLFLMSMFNPGKLKEGLGNLYKQAEANLPQGVLGKANKLQDNLIDLKEKVTKGRPERSLAASEKFVIDEIDKISDLIADGKISIEQAVAQKRSLNETLQKHLYETPDRGAQQRAKNLAKPLNHYLKETIEDYGKTNPKFYQPFKQAEEGFGVMANSNFISKWVEKGIGYKPVTTGLLHLFGSGLGSGLSMAAVPYHATKIGYRIAHSPILRKLYSEALAQAAKENAPSFTKTLKKLDQELQADENQDKFEFID